MSHCCQVKSEATLTGRNNFLFTGYIAIAIDLHVLISDNITLYITIMQRIDGGPLWKARRNDLPLNNCSIKATLEVTLLGVHHVTRTTNFAHVYCPNFPMNYAFLSKCVTCE